MKKEKSRAFCIHLTLTTSFLSPHYSLIAVLFYIQAHMDPVDGGRVDILGCLLYVNGFNTHVVVSYTHVRVCIQYVSCGLFISCCKFS